MKVSGNTAFAHDAIVFKNALGLMGACFADALDMPESQGSKIFVKGAVFYAGVFAELYPHHDGVPVDEYTFRKLGSEDLRVNTWTVSERIQEDIPSYCELLEQTMPAMNIETAKEHNLALIGSGVVHAVAVDSLRNKQLFEGLEEGFSS